MGRVSFGYAQFGVCLDELLPLPPHPIFFFHHPFLFTGMCAVVLRSAFLVFVKAATSLERATFFLLADIVCVVGACLCWGARFIVVLPVSALFRGFVQRDSGDRCSWSAILIVEGSRYIPAFWLI
jgi:hypothetical protein